MEPSSLTVAAAQFDETCKQNLKKSAVGVGVVKQTHSTWTSRVALRSRGLKNDTQTKICGDTNLEQDTLIEKYEEEVHNGTMYMGRELSNFSADKEKTDKNRHDDIKIANTVKYTNSSTQDFKNVTIELDKPTKLDDQAKIELAYSKRNHCLLAKCFCFFHRNPQRSCLETGIGNFLTYDLSVAKFL